MTPPKSNEIQVVFFGPGYGESILIHLGDSHWIIIDSCLDDERNPAPISFLRQVGVNPATDVKLVLATHWHDDHIKGLSTVLAECTAAKFAMSAAMLKTEFIAYLIAHDRQPHTNLDRGGTEIIKCLKLLNDGRRIVTLVTQDKVLKSWDSGYFSHDQAVELLALSPSDELFRTFLLSVSSCLDAASSLPGPNAIPKTRIGSLGRNDLSIATLITIGGIAILLGADVEVKDDVQQGWDCIVDSRTDRKPRPYLFKVAHHGSDGAHSSRLWADVLSKSTVSVVTPWRVGGKSLPTTEAKHRLAELSDKAFITSALQVSTKKRYGREILKLIEHGGVKVSPSLFRSGAVIFKIDAVSGDFVETSLLNGAVQL
jgi:beta-lactamase superfamily II metal-dependent hydrolase